MSDLRTNGCSGSSHLHSGFKISPLASIEQAASRAASVRLSASLVYRLLEIEDYTDKDPQD